MKSLLDILRIMAEMNTFTCEDLANELDFTTQGANRVLIVCIKGRHVERVRVGHTYAYAITPKAQRMIDLAGMIDPDERLLPLTFEGFDDPDA